jgi:outer membrane protein OmpA-like peptidoglycan-associated protein
MSRKLMVSTLVLASMTAVAVAASLGGCQAEVSATAGTGASTPAPPATTPPAPDPTPAPTPAPAPAIKAVKNVQIEKDQVKIPGEIEFDSGKASIRETPAGTEVMNALLDFMQTNAQVTKLAIEGHTDNVPPKDKATTNQALSQQRAENVVGWLVAKGIKKDRLTATGLGDTKPKEKNDTDAHKQANRRTEFHIIEVDGKAFQAGGAGTTAAGTGGGATTATSAAGTGSAKPAASVPPKK